MTPKVTKEESVENIKVDKSHYEFPLRVYYEDTDAGGIVYYANYLKFMERARTEWLRERGFEQDFLREEQGIIFVVRAVNIEYLKPAIFNDQLTITVSLTDLQKTHLTCQQRVINTAILLTEAAVSLVCVDANSLKPKRIPEDLRCKLR